jgi:hypothetical protein
MNEKIWVKINKVAEANGIPYGTRNKWKNRGFVPAYKHHELVSEAKKLRIKLTYDELNGV